MQNFHTKLLAAGVSAIFFGNTGFKPMHHPLDDQALSDLIADEKMGIGDIIAVRAFLPLDGIRLYNCDPLIVAGQSGNPDNLGLLVCENKKLNNKIPSDIGVLVETVKQAHAEGVFAKIGHKKSVGEIMIGPMQVVQYVATDQGWKLITEDEPLAEDSEQVQELRDQIGLLAAENKKLKAGGGKESPELETMAKERDELKVKLDAERAGAVVFSDELSKLNDEIDSLRADLETAHKDLETATQPDKPKPDKKTAPKKPA